MTADCGKTSDRSNAGWIGCSTSDTYRHASIAGTIPPSNPWLGSQRLRPDCDAFRACKSMVQSQPPRHPERQVAASRSGNGAREPAKAQSPSVCRAPDNQDWVLLLQKNQGYWSNDISVRLDKRVTEPCRVGLEIGGRAGHP